MPHQPHIPYNDLPLLPPKIELETKEVLKAAIKANRALAKLVGSGRQLPNQSMLVHAIALQEAKMSSEIENIVTTNDELYKAMALEGIVDNIEAKEVLHYNNALWQGFAFVKANGFLHTNLFTKLASIIKETDAGIRNTPGTKISSQKTGKIIYTPPEGETIIRGKLKNLEDFINSNEDDLDPLIKMAIIHYQFEAIHPFYDGNGRTGRIINILYMVNESLLELPILYLSKYIIENKERYYEGLRAVTEDQAWHAWILYMLKAIEETAQFTQQKIDAIINLMTETRNQIHLKAPELDSKDLLEALFQQPYCKRKILERELKVSIKTAGQYLQKLEEVGILNSVKVKKEKLYINRPLFQILRTA